MLLTERLKLYAQLMRLHQPIGILLLLWPTMWALWLASRGHPSIHVVLVFFLGVIIMRSAGCIINDIADRRYDKHVLRTQDRPLTKNTLRASEAWINLIGLLGLALLLVISLKNIFLIQLAIVGALLTFIYPFMKRYTHFPQLFLGAAFAWGIPMAFAAQKHSIPPIAWFVYAAGLIWPIIYDTMYAMVDREDDKTIGIKSTAIFFGHQDRLFIGIFQSLLMILFVYVGIIYALKPIYYVMLSLAVLFFIYQQWLIAARDPERCFQAFLNNHWIGFVVFIGIFLGVR